MTTALNAEQQNRQHSAPAEKDAAANPKNASRWARFCAWFTERQWRLSAFAIAFSITILLLWPHTVITVGPGHVGVKYLRFLGGTRMDRIFPEGTHFIFPWDTLFLFDTRVHEDLYTLKALCRNGMLIDIDISILYRPAAIRTPELLVQVGQDYTQKIIIPSLQSAVRLIAARHDSTEFYSENFSKIQDEILVAITEAIARRPLIVDNLFIRTVYLPDSVNAAINAKLVAKEEVEQQFFRVQESLQRFKITVVDAEAIRRAQEIVNPNMTEDFLRLKGIEATRMLADSPNTKFVIAGGKDGLPLILNPDSPLSPAKDQETTPEKPKASRSLPSPSAAPGTGSSAAPGAGSSAAPGAVPPDLTPLSLETLEEQLRSLTQSMLPGESQSPQAQGGAAAENAARK